MITIPRTDIDPMPEDIRAWACGDDLVPAPKMRPRPVTAAAALMAGGALGLAIVAVIGRIVVALA